MKGLLTGAIAVSLQGTITHAYAAESTSSLVTKGDAEAILHATTSGGGILNHEHGRALGFSDYSRAAITPLSFHSGTHYCVDDWHVVRITDFNSVDNVVFFAFDIEADGSLSNWRVWAEGLGPDGICMDAEGAIWVGGGGTRTHTGRNDAPEGAVVRVREGGEVRERIEHDRAIFAVMLGGADRKKLFLLATEWRGIEQVNEAVAARTGQVLVSQAPGTGAGWP